MNFQDLESRRYFIAVGGFLAVLFALLGPEGSTRLGLAARLLQWTAQVAIPLALLIASHLLGGSAGGLRRPQPFSAPSRLPTARPGSFR